MAITTKQEAINFLVKKYPFLNKCRININGSCTKNADEAELKTSYKIFISLKAIKDAPKVWQCKTKATLAEAVQEIDQQLQQYSSQTAKKSQ